MVNVRADLEDCFAKSKTMPGTRSSHHFAPRSWNKIGHKLTFENREFLQFDFNKIIDRRNKYKKHQVFFECQLYLRYILVDWHSGWSECTQGDLKIEYLHSHGKTFNWPALADKWFDLASYILCVITAPTTITGRTYPISDTAFESTLKAYENHKM